MTPREDRIQAGRWTAALWLLRDPSPIIRAQNRQLVDDDPVTARRRNVQAYAAEGIRYMIRQERARQAAGGVLANVTVPVLGEPEGYHYLQNHQGQRIGDEAMLQVVARILEMPNGQRGYLMRRVYMIGRRATKGQQALKIIAAQLRGCREGAFFDRARWGRWKRQEEKVQRYLDQIGSPANLRRLHK